MNNHQPLFRPGFIFSLMLMVMFAASPTWAEVTCGSTIGPSEVVRLDQDLF